MTRLLQHSIRFGAVGLVNTAIGLSAIYTLMFVFRADPAVANAFGYALGLSASFVLNRGWTFKDTRPSSYLLPRFLLVVAVSYLLNLVAVLAATLHFSVNPYLAQLLGVAVYTACMFLGCRVIFTTPRVAGQSS